MRSERRTFEPKPLFLERMKKILSDEKDFNKWLEISKIQPQNSIRCNTLKISPEKLKKILEEEHKWKISQPWKNYPEVMIVEGKFDTTPKSTLSDFSEENIINMKKTLKLCSIDNSSIKNYSDDNNLSAKNLGASEILSNKSERQRDKLNIISLEPGELGRELEHLLGYYYIQELSSMLSAIALSPEKNETVLDLCAAPGSKTTEISAKMENTGTIIANEVSLPRLRILASNLERCGCSNTIITKKDGIALCKRLQNKNLKFTKILVDVPCSGEGTLRSSPKTYLMWNIKTIKNLPRLQFSLFANAFEILEKNGEIIYSTCTHSPEENEGVVDKILNEFKDQIEILKPNLPIEIKTREGITNWENQEYNKKVKFCARIYPQDNNSEGFFIAKFRRMK